MFSTASEAITTLTTISNASSDFEGLAVLDGRVPGNSAKPNSLVYGYTTEDDPLVAEGSFDFEGASSRRGREEYTINAAIRLLTGSTGKVQEQHTRAFDLLGKVARVLYANRSLSGLLLTSKIAGWSLAQAQGPTGLLTTLAFDIECNGFTKSVAEEI